MVIAFTLENFTAWGSISSNLAAWNFHVFMIWVHMPHTKHVALAGLSFWRGLSLRMQSNSQTTRKFISSKYFLYVDCLVPTFLYSKTEGYWWGMWCSNEETKIGRRYTLWCYKAWPEYLTSPPKRGVDTFSSVSTFNHELKSIHVMFAASWCPWSK